ncbi:hypothetical protein B0H94_11836 [Salsuginibacillus halophilus]|uniref:Uncharacterized protein n=1 Tax=Salsuginibacillus halophilus TaxID=517424 RepID=A0A2P8H692_9BACI|nr:hypothetical protein [Salsuginibacillus halophilus]PSL41723.1 hypothetical protein B0H94_11836 [Salsuginibacillus halophilus]
MKRYEKGDPYRPRTIVEKSKKGVPTVLRIKGQRYVLEQGDSKRGVQNRKGRKR